MYIESYGDGRASLGQESSFTPVIAFDVEGSFCSRLRWIAAIELDVRASLDTHLSLNPASETDRSALMDAQVMDCNPILEAFGNAKVRLSLTTHQVKWIRS
jgi:hypothetical protein